MNIEILFFGQLTDITDCTSIVIENPGSIGQLKSTMLQKFPELMHKKFTIALNNKIVQDEEIILDNSKIALMPPFSGG
jgi:molybdopterin synthase sulfur carrier subunit